MSEGAYSKEVAQLLRFYQKETLIELVMAQAEHVRRLQAQVPPIQDNWPKKVREG